MNNILLYVLSLGFLFFSVIGWVSKYYLRHAMMSAPDNMALKERARTALFLALASSLNGLLALSVIFGWHFGPLLGTAILTTSLILGSIPNLYWLILYQKNRLHR